MYEIDFERMTCPACYGSKVRHTYDGPMPCDECCGYGEIPDYARPIKKEKKGMNYSTAVMLINTNIRAILVSYEVHADGKGAKPFVMFKTLDHTVKAGDYLVVPTDTRHKHTVVRVEEVDVDVDFEDPTIVKWALDKVDTANADKILVEETKWVEALKAAEKRKKREEIKKSMLEFAADDSLEKLPIAGFSDVAALEHKGDDKK